MPRTVFSDDFLVAAAPAAAYYIPDFITVEEEEYILRKIDDSPKTCWKTLGNRRLQLWGGEVQKNVLFRSEMPPFLTSYPNVIGRLRETKAFTFSPHKEPNHVILNEYLAGQGIMPHEDGPSYHPVVGTVSLGSHAVFHYYAYSSEINRPACLSSGRAIDPKPVLSVFLEPRSVIVTTGALYASHLHGIDGVMEDVFLDGGRVQLPTGGEVVLANWRKVQTKGLSEVLHYGGTLDRGTRYSLTCRDVEKVVTPMKGQLRWKTPRLRQGGQ